MRTRHSNWFPTGKHWSISAAAEPGSWDWSVDLLLMAPEKQMNGKQICQMCKVH